MTRPHAPFVLELDGPQPTPAEVAPIPEETDPLPPSALAAAMAAGAGGQSFAMRLFFWAVGLFLSLALSIGTYEFVVSMLTRWPLLGTLAGALALVAVAALLWMAGREWAALMRLSKIDHLREKALAAQNDLPRARALVAEVSALYAGRGEMAAARAGLQATAEEQFDPDALVQLAESTLLALPDQAARREIESAARKVAAATALVPLALVDVAVALSANLRMIRRIAVIYGGRGGRLGSLRLLKRVFSHLVATGAVAVGEDLISSVAGGGVMSKVSRRFGEGVINGALTARVGIAAMEVCRPLPFAALPRPKVTNLLSRALTGLFGRD